MKLISITTLMLLCFGSVSGQSIQPATLISSSNYYRSSSDISLYSSMGEFASETISNGEQSMSQGFLQAYLDLVPTSELDDPDLNMIIGPNPCATHFTINKNQDTELTAYLFTLHGQQVRQVELQDQQTSIDVAGLPAGSYFLVIHQAQKQIFQTTKIIKI